MKIARIRIKRINGGVRPGDIIYYRSLEQAFESSRRRKHQHFIEAKSASGLWLPVDTDALARSVLDDVQDPAPRKGFWLRVPNADQSPGGII